MKATTHGLAAVLLLFAISTARAGDPADAPRISDHPHYEIDLEIRPSAQMITVSGTLTLSAAAVSDSLVFHLHEQLNVESFSVGRPHAVHFDPDEPRIRFLPHARRIVVTFAEQERSGEPVVIRFAYRGAITEWPGWSASVIGKDWTEIGLYFPWYPYSFDHGVFTYDLTVTSDPGHELAAMGTIESEDGGWRVSCPDPTNDIVVCLARDLRVHETEMGGNRLCIYHSGIPQPALTALSADLVGIARSFNEWFGTIDRDLCLIESRRAKGGGYGRIGGVFLGGFDGEKFLAEREEYNRYLAHEISHQWWHRAPSSGWEDWLNESFAEYSALLLLRSRFGAERFSQRLADKKKNSADTPPIRGCDRNGEAAQKILYDKGPVLLGELEERIGRDGFLRLCSEVFDKRVSATNEFLELLERREGESCRIWFEHQLETR